MSEENEASFHFLAENSVDIICRAGLDMVLHYVLHRASISWAGSRRR